MENNGAGLPRFLRFVQCLEVVRLMFRLRTGSVELLEGRRREWCRRRCGAFMVTSGEFEWDRRVLANEVNRIVGAREWLWNMEECKEDKVALLLGKIVEGVSDTVMVEVGECVCIG